MSAEASIPMSPAPGKDPPARPHPRAGSTAVSSSTSTSPPISTSAHLAPPSTSLPNTSPTSPALPHSISDSRSMPPPPSRLSTSSIPYIQPPTEIQSQTQDQPPELPRPDFTPIFTLISDTSTQSTHHPNKVHYIFSDDDESEMLSAACVRSLQQRLEQESPAASRELEKSQVSEQTSSSSSATFRKASKENKGKGVGKAKARREERVIIVDLNPTGDGIVSTSSLSENWQIVNAEMSNAPTFNNNESADVDGERGMMLRIEGVGIEEEGSGKVAGSGVVGEEEVQVLLDGFDRKMGELRKIVAAGERWAGERERGKGIVEVEEGGQEA